jgi:hypothetical protein
MEYQKACGLTLAEGLELELVYEDQNAESCIKKGVKLRINVQCKNIIPFARMYEVPPLTLESTWTYTNLLLDALPSRCGPRKSYSLVSYTAFTT